MENELEQLGERIAEQAAHLDAATHRLLADLRAFDTRGGWHVQGAASCAHWLAWGVGGELGTARDHVRVARKLAGFAAIDDALRRGEVSYSKVRAMLRVATPENELLLLEHAKLMTASQLEKLCRKYALVLRHGEDPHPQGDEQRRYVRRRDTEDGMIKIAAVLHPEEPRWSGRCSTTPRRSWLVSEITPGHPPGAIPRNPMPHFVRMQPSRTWGLRLLRGTARMPRLARWGRAWPGHT